jgi:prevent-host-death family protein
MRRGIAVGSFEAKTRLSALLEQVERGEVVTITRRGRPVARLVPATDENDAKQASQAVARLRALRQGATLAGLDWRELRDTGRR